MGIVKIGRTEYNASNVEVKGNCVILDGVRKIYVSQDDSNIQVKIHSKPEDRISLISDVDVIVTGNINRVNCRNLCLWGRAFRVSYGSNRFFNTTGKETYRKIKADISKKPENGRVIVHFYGDFEKLSVVRSIVPVEVVVSGSITECYSKRDVYCKGDIQRSRIMENGYISSK